MSLKINVLAIQIEHKAAKMIVDMVLWFAMNFKTNVKTFPELLFWRNLFVIILK
ncbi:MAG: hypothetical protein KGZ97_00155 [Bacteroidetes bacterium]|nr:hypothetical protein [Bacteroidota bacterium]